MSTSNARGLAAVIAFVFLAAMGAIKFADVGRAETRRAMSDPAIETKPSDRVANLPGPRPARNIPVAYRGTGDVVTALQTAQAESRALASTDLNGDAAPDMIAGYAWSGAGIITIQRGNTDAFAPTDESVFERMQKGFNPDPLVPAADTYRVPASVDFLQVGDFNHDNQKDVLTAARGGDMYLLAGDGRGTLAEPERIDLPGAVTAMTSGEFRAADGRTDVAVAVDGPRGPELIVYDGLEGVTGEPLTFQLGAGAASLAMDALDDDPYRDIAAIAGGSVEIVHGWGRKQKVDQQSRIERIPAESDAHDLATGFFVWNRSANSQMAVRSDDGAIRVLVRGAFDERPFTDAELAERARGRARLTRDKADIEDAEVWRAGSATAWHQVRAFAGDAPAEPGASGGIFQRSHISFGQMDDILISDGAEPGLRAVRQSDDESLRPGGGDDLVAHTFGTGTAATAFLVLPQKLNGERDLMTIGAGSSAPVMTAFVGPSITVDMFTDPAGIPSACTAAGGDCSLRGAVQFANIPANAGTTINLPAGTYLLTIPGSGGCVVENNATGNTIGDLEINKSTTLVGAGSLTTVIRQAAATNDRVICMDVPLTANLSFIFSAMTIAGGRDTSINGGAGFLGGALDAVTNFTDVTFVNNQYTGANAGGGGALITGGSMTVANCTFGAANLPGADRTNLTLANASTQTSGGGLSYTSGDPAGSNGALGTLTMTGTIFTHNTTGSGGAGGGGLDVFGRNLSTPTVNVSTTSFTNNQATGTASGGGIINESANLTIATTAFTSNSASNRGGGLYVAGGSTVLDGTVNGINFSGNTATSGGTSVSTASTVNMLGTNTTIGGSIQVEAGGIWNNSTATLAPTDIVIAGGTFNCNASTMNVAGNLTLGPSGNGIFGGTFNGNGGTVNLAGNLTTNTGGTTPAPSFNGNAGTFNFNGGGAQSSGGTLSPTFNNLTVNKTGTLTLGVNSSVTGNLTLTAGNFDLGAFTVNRSAAGGSLTVSNGTLLKIGGTNPLPANYNTHSIGSTSTIEYSGTTQTVSTLNSAQTYGHLTISGSGTKTQQAATTVAGNLTINGGTLDVSGTNFALNVAGNFTNNVAAANFNPRAGTVTFNGSGAQGLNGTAASQSFNNFVVNKGNTLTVGGSTASLSISGAVTLTAGTFDAGSATAIGLTTGDWTNNGGTFTPASSVVSFTNTAAAQNINGTAAAQTFNSITMAKTAQNLTVGGSTTTLNLNGTMLLTSGTFTPGTAANVNIGTNWTNNGGTFTPGSGTVTFNGGGAQSLNGTAAAQTFNNFAVNKGGGTLTGSGSTTGLTINGGVTLTSGTFAAGSITAIGLASGDWTNNGGVFTPGTSVVSFTNTAAAQALNGTNASQTFGGITVAKTAQTLTVGGSTATLNLNGTMLLTSGTLATGAVAINVGGNWTNNGGVFSGSSAVTFNGSSPQLINGTASSQNFNGNLSVGSSSSLSTGGSTTTIGVGSLAMVSGTFNTPAVLNVNGGVTSLGGTIVAGGSINLGGSAATYDFRNCTFTAGSGTVNVIGTGAQSFKIANGGSLNNFTVNTTGSVTATGSPFTINGLLMITSGTFFVGGNTLDVNGNTRFIGTLDATTGGSSITAAGDWDNSGGGIFNPGASTVTFDGAGAQSIKGDAETFNNFTVNKSVGTLTGTGSVTALTFTGAMTLTAGTFAPGTIASIGVAGNWTNNGATFTPGVGTVTFNGSAPQSIGGTTSTPFNGLTLNNPAGATLGINTTVNGALTLTNGELATGASTLSIGNAGTTSRTNGFVVGTMQKSFNTLGSFTYPVGTIGAYSPMDVTVTAGTGSLTAKPNAAVAPLAPVGLDPTKTLHRYWTLSGSGITSNITFHYIDPTDVFGTEANYRVIRVTGGTTSVAFPNSANVFVTPASDSFTVMGLSSYSDWTAGEPIAPTAANVEVSGRVLNQNGQGLSGARVSMTNTGGATINAVTNAFGYYRFTGVAAGQEYVIAATHKLYAYRPRLISVTDTLTDIDFVPSP